MGDAGHEVALRSSGEERKLPDLVDRIAERYLCAANGNAEHALRLAITDGVEAASLVSRGFARWGWSDSRRRPEEAPARDAIPSQTLEPACSRS